jgi:hypothetical protein
MQIIQERVFKKENNIEEFWRRRIVMGDFLQGEPCSELAFSKETRKFNRVSTNIHIINYIFVGIAQGYSLGDRMQAYQC